MYSKRLDPPLPAAGRDLRQRTVQGASALRHPTGQRLSQEGA